MKFKRDIKCTIELTATEVKNILDYLREVKPKNKEIPKIPFDFMLGLSDSLE